MTTTTTTTETSQKNGSPAPRTLPAGWHKWPTATHAARRLGVSRQHMYRLAATGRVRMVEGVSMGRRVQRFDPASLPAATPIGGDDDDGGEELDDDELDDDELDDEAAELGGLVTPEQQVARLLADARRQSAESRRAAREARRDQRETIQLYTAPLRELHRQLTESLTQAYARIRELEEQQNRYFDERRDQRREDRELAIAEEQARRDSERKDRFVAAALEHAPLLVGMLQQSGRPDAGPLGDYLRALAPEQQRELVGAIEALMAPDDTASAPAAARSPTNDEDA